MKRRELWRRWRSRMNSSFEVFLICTNPEENSLARRWHRSLPWRGRLPLGFEVSM